MRKFIIALFFAVSVISFSMSADAGFSNRQIRGPSRGGRGPGPQRRPNSPNRDRRGGHVGHPMFVHLGPMPRGGWHGNPYYWEGRNYFVWGWAPGAPFWGWPYYYGWRIGLYYYVPEGLRCYADNPYVQGEWPGRDVYYSSDDAVDSALGFCESDPDVQNAHAESACRIRNCVRW